MMDKTKLSDVERDLIEGMEGFLDDLKSDAPIKDSYTCHKVTLDLKPSVYNAERVKATRKLLRLSQALFAQFLGVSPQTVRAWEQGKKPSDMACRIMDEIQNDPGHWIERIKQSVRVKTS